MIYDDDSDMDAIIEASLAAGVVRYELCLLVGLTTGTWRLWSGVGARVFGGDEWLGIGNIVSVSDAARNENGQADPFTVAVVADETIINRALIGFNAEAKDRPLRLYLQFFDPSSMRPVWNSQAGREVAPWQFQEGIIRGASLELSRETQVLTFKCDTLTSYRTRPPFGMLTDRHQQALYPGDRGLEEAAQLDGKEIEWPEF